MKYRNYIISILVFLFYCKLSIAQVDTVKIAQKYNDIDVLILPYETEMYINYEEAYLAKASEKTPYQINNFFRVKLDKAIVEAFSKYAKTQSLLNNVTYNINEDLVKIYRESSYFYDETGKKFKTSPLFETERSKLANDERSAEKGELYSQISNNENKFLNVKHSDPGCIKKIIYNNKADFMIFITQFEIKGDYSNPYTVTTMSYDRRMKVHFSTFNKAGQNTGGGYVYEVFNAKENDLNNIVSIHFPIIAEKLVALSANSIKK